MAKGKQKTISVVDLFAGPGGLGEGFSRFQTQDGQMPFEIALSIEKEQYAHSTLTMRSFFRQFDPGSTPRGYYDYLRDTNEPEPVRRRRLFDAWPQEAERAIQSTLLAELGIESPEKIRMEIHHSVQNSREFILIGGPPCQAYSVIGRSRNSGNPRYNATKDRRQSLYVEYLQVLADHHPALFIMENVKGLLSATLENQRIFARILEDLHSPCEAMLRENRQIADRRRRTRYRLFAISGVLDSNAKELPNFVVRMEKHGIPQARHRVIVIGIRSDLGITQLAPIPTHDQIAAEDVISDLPSVRSGISREKDEWTRWLNRIFEIQSYPFMNGHFRSTYGNISSSITDVLKSILKMRLTRGGEFCECEPKTKYLPDWYIDRNLHGVCNHTTRVHIPSDLHRYMYAACFAKLQYRSPNLRDFPVELLPEHRNARKSIKDGTFQDRFHVQLPSRPSTTVTSHLAKDGHYFIHPDPHQCRSMTVREVARLQTFPDNYFFCGPRTAQYTQVGNAVPPLLANHIAASVYQVLKKCGFNI